MKMDARRPASLLGEYLDHKEFAFRIQVLRQSGQNLLVLKASLQWE